MKNKFEKEREIEVKFKYLNELNNAVSDYIVEFEKRTKRDLFKLLERVEEVEKKLENINNVIIEEVKEGLFELTDEEE